MPSCKKSEQITKQANNKLDVSSFARTAEDDALESRIQDFYVTVKEVHEGTSKSETLSVDSVEFLTEAAYNYYVARTNFDRTNASYSFTFEKTNEGAIVPMTTIADAFYQIKDSILVITNNINYSGKSLSSFDLEIETNGSNIRYTVHFSVTASDILNTPVSVDPNTGQRSVVAANNYAWSAIYNFAPSPNVEGQATIDIPNKSVIATYTNKPGAPIVIRNEGVQNYYFNYAPAYTLATDIIQQSLTINSTSQNPYSAMGILGFYDVDQYSCEMFSDVEGSFVIDDADKVFKQWLITDVMNFYISKVSSKIISGIPTGRYFYNLDIKFTTCLCGAFSPTMSAWNKPYFPYDHIYTLSHCNATGIDISFPPYSLSTF